MLKRLILATSMGLAMLLMPATSRASTIPYDCAKCSSHNTAFDINYTVLDPVANTYELTVTAWYQPAGAGAMDYTYINAISMKFDGLAFQNGTPTLTEGPDGGPWVIGPGGLGDNGCTGNGNGFFCVNSQGAGAAHLGAGDTDRWVFLLDLAAPLGASTPVTFKAHFVNANGAKVGDLIGSEFLATPPNEPAGPNVPTAVPEPASLVLLGAGLSILAIRLRKRA